MAADNKMLGQFDLVGIPPAPRGMPQARRLPQPCRPCLLPPPPRKGRGSMAAAVDASRIDVSRKQKRH
eukprot:812510-Pleurochrysis_carterae.AAC.2